MSMSDYERGVTVGAIGALVALTVRSLLDGPDEHQLVARTCILVVGGTILFEVSERIGGWLWPNDTRPK